MNPELKPLTLQEIEKHYLPFIDDDDRNGNTMLFHHSSLTSNILIKLTNQDDLRESCYKHFALENLSLDVIMDALLVVSEEDAEKLLRVPLTTLVSYKGFRGLAIAHIKIEE